jgi:hypothetical protein
MNRPNLRGTRVSGGSRGAALVLASLAAVWLTGCGEGGGVMSFGTGDDTQAMASYENQLKEEAQAREADPAWKPSESQVAVIQVNTGDAQNRLNNFCLDAEGRVLACVGGAGSKGGIEVISPEGARVTTWPLETNPQAICRAPDGSFIVGGSGKLLRLDAAGKILATGKTPNADAALPSDDDLKELSKRFGEGSPAERLERLKTILTTRRLDVSGVAAMGDDVFVACPSTQDFTFVVYRLDKDFGKPTQVVDKLSGCCSQMDIQARDGKLWVANNGRHRVQIHDRDGKLLSTLGKQDRKAADGFGGCCEPKNIRLLASGEVLTAESGPPVAIKRFSADGKFLGVVAVPTYATDCVRSTVEVSPDGKRHYILNPEGKAIHVFAARN